MKTVKCLEESDLLRKFVNKTIKNKARRWISQHVVPSMLLGTLVVNLLENLLTGKGVKAKIPGRGVITPGEGTPRAGQNLNPPHPLPNSEM